MRRAGRVIIDLNKLITALNVIPNRRKGISSNHPIGYNIKKRMAKGQEMANKINHNNIFMILFFQT
jgi:hypothetical protein